MSGRKVACIVANAKYKGSLQLDAPLRDAATFQHRLVTDADFLEEDVKLLLDVDPTQLKKELREWHSQVYGSSIALLLYAGHGAEYKGEQFVMCSTWDGGMTAVDLEIHGLGLQWVLQRALQGCDQALIILDACRAHVAEDKGPDRPKGATAAPIGGWHVRGCPNEECVAKLSRGGGHGDRSVIPILTAFACLSGGEAIEQTEQGLFTAALMKFMFKEDETLLGALDKAIRYVYQQTNYRQQPQFDISFLHPEWATHSLLGNLVVPRSGSQGPQLTSQHALSGEQQGNLLGAMRPLNPSKAALQTGLLQPEEGTQPAELLLWGQQQLDRQHQSLEQPPGQRRLHTNSGTPPRPDFNVDQLSQSQNHQSHRSGVGLGSDVVEPANQTEVVLNPADCSLDCQLVGQCASTLSDEGFAYLWSGVRATHGITSGRYWFSVQILDPLETNEDNLSDSTDMYCIEDATANKHCCRIGISRHCAGVDTLGWGYGSMGKKSSGKYPADYPERAPRKFGPGDEVTCFVELSPNNTGSKVHGRYDAAHSGYTYGTPGISFAVNGECLGLAYPIYSAQQQQQQQQQQQYQLHEALFPHVLVKNLSVLVKFKGERPLRWPEDKPWDRIWCGCLPWQDCVSQNPALVLGPSLRTVKDCHVIMMIGLPCAGKSRQIANLMGSRQQHGFDQQQQQQQRYILLSSERILSQMVADAPRRGGTAAAPSTVLIEEAEIVLQRLLGLASQRPRNYIIDGCNVLAERRLWILENFRVAGFKLIAAVVVEQDHVINQRMMCRTERRPAPDDFLVMKANFTLPEVDSSEFHEVRYLGNITDPLRAEAIVEAQRAAAQRALQGRCDRGTLLGGQGSINVSPERMLREYGSGLPSTSQVPAGLSGVASMASERTGRDSGDGHVSSTVLGYGPAGAGFTPYHSAEQLNRWTHGMQSSAVQYQLSLSYQQQQQQGSFSFQQQQQQQGLAFASMSAGFYGQHPAADVSQYGASIYNHGVFAAGMGPATPEAIPFAPQYSVETRRRRSSSGGNDLADASSYKSDQYIQQSSYSPPAWQDTAAYGRPLHGSGQSGNWVGSNNNVVDASHQGIHGRYSTEATEGPGLGNRSQLIPRHPLPSSHKPPYSSRDSTPDGRMISQHEGYGPEQQQRQQQCQQQQQSAWPRSSGMGQRRPAGATQQQNAAAAATLAPVAVGGHASRHDLSTSAIKTTKHSSSSSSSRPGIRDQQQADPHHQQQCVVGPRSPSVMDVQQRQQLLLPQQPQQQQVPSLQEQAPSLPHPLQLSEQHFQSMSMDSAPPEEDNPFLAAAKLATWPSQDMDADTNLVLTPAPAATAAGSTSSNGHSNSQAQLQQQQRVSQQQQQARELMRRLGSSFGLRFSAGSDDDAAAADAAINLSPELQQQLEQLQLPSFTSESVVAAAEGKGSSGRKAKRLGSGSFGSVFACLLSDLQRCSPAVATGPTYVGSDGEVAVKVLNSRHCSAADFACELEVLARCHHKNLVALQGYCLPLRALVLEYCSCGSLDDWLKGSRSVTQGRLLSWSQRLSIAHQVAEALHFLHSRKPEPVIHRDVKPNNILLSRDMSPRLADVGLSKFIPLDATSVYASRLGCIHFMPNEYLLHQVVSLGADVFGFGLVLVQIVTGEVRFPPKKLLSQLAGVLSGHEAVLKAAADESSTPTAAALAATGSASSSKVLRGVETHVPPACGTTSNSSRSSAEGAAAVASGACTARGAPGAASGDASAIGPSGGAPPSISNSSTSHWWLGVMANCKSSNIGSGGISSNAGSSNTGGPPSAACAALQPPASSPVSVVEVTAAAAAAGGVRTPAVEAERSGEAGPEKVPASWASVAAAPRPPRPPVATSATAGSAAGCTPCSGIQTPAVAAADIVPATLPPSLAKMLDDTAGVWPPSVAMGLCMMALACCEEQRRKRPTMDEIVRALQGLLHHATLEKDEQQ